MFTKLKLLLTFIAFSSIFPHSLQAQGTCDFSIDTKVTGVDCLANGIIEISLDGTDLADMNSFLYRVYPEGDNPDNYDLVSESSFSGLKEGTYTVEATGFCTKNGVRVEKSKKKVSVPRISAYSKPDFKIYENFIAGYSTNSRYTLPCFPTGAIAINTITGTKGPYTFRFTKYPAAYTGSTTLVDKVAKLSTTYTFGDLPAGTYEIEIEDGCGGAQKRSVTLGTIKTSSVIPLVIDSKFYFKYSTDNCKGLSIHRPSSNPDDYYANYYLNWREDYYEYATYYPGDDMDNLKWENFPAGSNNHITYKIYSI